MMPRKRHQPPRGITLLYIYAMSLASALIEPLPVSSLHVPSGWLAGEQGFTPEDALWNSSLGR